MISIAFKYTGKKPIELVTSELLLCKLRFIGYSHIDNFPIYKTTGGLIFEDYIQDILNEKEKNKLKIILRKNKLDKIIKKENLLLSLNYEFLNFWYNNYDDLTTMIPLN